MISTSEMARRAAEINFEIFIRHGVGEGRVGFEWQETFIHNPFVDPQYGAFEVDPVEQYGDAYLESIFVIDPGEALRMAQQQLRERAGEDLIEYLGRNMDVADIIETIAGVRVRESARLLATLTDKQVVRVWSHVDGIAENAWED